MLTVFYPYKELDMMDNLPSKFLLLDHIGGFDKNITNNYFDNINTYAECNNKSFCIDYCQILENSIKEKYPRLQLEFNFKLQNRYVWKPLSAYNQHPELSFNRFLCSFNGSDHVGRKLLVAALHRWGWFDPETCSKNFRFTVDKLDGHLGDYLDPDQHRFHRPFFIGADSERFFDRIYSFGHVRFDHTRNIYNLERQLTASFLHVVSECMATSYYPFVSEKFLYSVVTRSLFLAHAQPGWHDHLERYYGFRRYDKIFDYRFDAILNPVERLVELMSMISKFSVLGTDDWRDLYEMEIDTIEYNYDWYFSKQYVKHLEKISS